MSDEKLQELLDAPQQHLASLNTAKTTSLSAINSAKTTSIDAIDKNHFVDCVTNCNNDQFITFGSRKDTNIAAIDSTGQTPLQALTGLLSNFTSINDIPNGSSIMTEVAKRNMV